MKNFFASVSFVRRHIITIKMKLSSMKSIYMALCFVFLMTTRLTRLCPTCRTFYLLNHCSSYCYHRISPNFFSPILLSQLQLNPTMFSHHQSGGVLYGKCGTEVQRSYLPTSCLLHVPQHVVGGAPLRRVCILSKEILAKYSDTSHS